MTRRRKFTEREVVAIVARQLGTVSSSWRVDKPATPIIICPICEEAITPTDCATIERDHERPLGLGGEDTPENSRFVHAACHKRKTHEEDRPPMHKADRQGGRRGSQTARRERKGPTMQSKPMQKPADVGRRHNWKTGRMEDA